MAASFVQTLGTSSVKAAGTTLATTFGATTTAGNVLVARVLFDNAATASKPVVSSISKPAGEVASWVFLGAARSTSTSAGAFASGELWAIRTTVAWPAAAVTVTVDTSTTMMANLFMEFSGATVTQRSTVGTNYSTTTTAASATTTGTTPQVGDLALGFLFGSNVAAVQAGDTDTTGGSWSAAVGLGSTGGNVATNNFGLGQHKILTAASHQTYNNSAAMTAGNGAIVAVLAATFATATMTLAATATASTTSTASLSIVAREFHRPWVENFSGGDWSRWDSSIGFSGDLATTLTVVGGAGFISTQGSPRCCPIVAPAIAATIADQGVTLTITPSSNITTNDKISLVLRGDGTWGTVGSSSFAPRPGTGYRLELQPNTIPQLFIDSNGAATENFPGGTTGGSNIVMTAGTPIKVRFEAVGARLRWRSWLASDTEPTGWTVTTNDDFTATSGLLGLAAFLFSTDVSYTVDDISWYLPSFPASSTASLSIKATHFALPWGEDFSGGDWSRWLDTPWTGDVVSNPPLRVGGGSGALASSRAGNSGGVNVYIADAIGKPQTDQGILVTVTAGSSNTAGDLFSLIIRGDGTWASGTTTSQPGAGYKLLMWPGAAGDMYAVSGGTSTFLPPTISAGATVVMAAGGPMKVRFEAVGQQIRFRSWMDGDPEPTTWRTSANTTTVASGIAGMGVWINSANNQYTVDDFQWYIPANTSNTSLTIEAAGVATAGGASTAALTLAASASAQVQASATASLSIFATATLSSTATASLTLAATGTAFAVSRAILTVTAQHFVLPRSYGSDIIGNSSSTASVSFNTAPQANDLCLTLLETSNVPNSFVAGWSVLASDTTSIGMNVYLLSHLCTGAEGSGSKPVANLPASTVWLTAITILYPRSGYVIATDTPLLGADTVSHTNYSVTSGASVNLSTWEKLTTLSVFTGGVVTPIATLNLSQNSSLRALFDNYNANSVGTTPLDCGVVQDFTGKADNAIVSCTGTLAHAAKGITAFIPVYEVVPTSPTATASLTIAASGSAVAAGTSTAALTISGTATGTATDTATASMSLDATGTAAAGAVAASATAVLSLAASGTAAATTTTTAALTIAASATALATTTTTAALVLAATATAQVSAASTAALDIVAGPMTVAAPATATAALAIAATGTARAAGTSTASLTIAATGTAQLAGVNTASMVLDGIATARAVGTSTAALALDATGTARAAGSSTASLVLASTGTASATSISTASMTLDATGAARAAGSSTGALTIAATGTARAAGSSTASMTLAGLATASTTSTGVLTIAASATAAATGSSTAALTVAATATASTTSTGVLTIAASGTARATSTSTATLAVVATGTAQAATTSTGTMTIAATAVASTTATATMTIAATGTARAAGTSTASLVLAGTAVASLGGTQTATMTLGATATAAATSTSTGSLTLAATGTAQGASTSTAALTLVAGATARASSTSTASLTLVAAATPAARASTNASLVIDATAVANLAGTNTALLTIASSATARVTASSTASLTLAATATISTSATATMTLGGTATARAALTSTAALTLDSSGVARAAGSSTGSLTVAATGVARAAGASTAALTMTATGAATVTASSTATMTFAGTATASITVTASTATLTLAAIGAAQVAGSSTAALVLDAVASATFGGTSTASLTLAADGSAQVTGSCSAVLSLVAIGAATVATSSTATLSLAATASAVVVALSAAVLDLVGVGTAAGAASAEATLVLSGVAITGVAQSDFEGWGIPL